MSPAGSGPAAVVTGLGAFTPLGRGAADLFDALCHGKSGLRRPPEDHPLFGVVDSVGMAPGITPAEVLPPSEGRLVDRFALMALAAADDAIADAGIVVGADVDPTRVAVVVSSGAGGLTTYEAQALERAERGPTAVSPYLLPGMLPNMAAARIAIKYGIRGWSSAIATACSAGAHAVAEAARLIRYGEADVVVCGGAESPLNATTALAFSHARALAHGFDDPEAASRPFDRRRKGFVLSEGAGVLVVERADFADARGASGYADLLGWGVSTDAYRPTAPRPDGEGAAQAMRSALASGGLGADDVDYVNAHGTATKLGDIAEAKAIRSVFAERSPAVSGTKSMTGHLLGGSGAVEAAICALAVAQGALPPTHNLDDPDPACELDHVVGGARRQDVRAVLSNSFAFGGHNVSLLLGAPSTRRTRAHGSGERKEHA
ncbi:beta-ketoacyl-[acyl-carrier-protein] synthase family protein [Streptacidiphilus sp. PB12-B1b]|uniref:beta-ketoacyl-[acyl-carrier-protein] synthase family protein n=1 Tax=Streptacidiphilus sp. PB12-B1b TaxID=2705012 RepID=UPI0015FA4185|nr:beta-ketoacyl-[acyl-carrier-protein] synthase family protein [Streptacidiphilus sp. PB12-B1b]QMU75759.1 beta-ketoacyl-[acyl-carrier-protein] synthase family protein [Streptacidiphilus sp. PB12-B1b]